MIYRLIVVVSLVFICSPTIAQSNTDQKKHACDFEINFTGFDENVSYKLTSYSFGSGTFKQSIKFRESSELAAEETFFANPGFFYERFENVCAENKVTIDRIQLKKDPKTENGLMLRIFISK